MLNTSKDFLFKNLEDNNIKFSLFNTLTRESWDNEIYKVKETSISFISFNLLYEVEYFNCNLDSSFFLYSKDYDEIFIMKFLIIESQLKYIQFYFSEFYDFKKGKTIIRVLDLFLKDKNYKILTSPYISNLNTFLMLKLKGENKIKSSIELFVNLNLSKDTLWMNLRKSYKGLINYTSKNLIISSEINEEVWKECEDFHIRTSGKRTRSHKTWEIQFDAISKGKAKLLYIKQEGKIIGFSLFYIGNKTSYYAVGVYDRSLFKKYGISHYLLWHHILYLKSNDFDCLYLGRYFSDELENDKKLNNIVDFKLGFANKLTSNIQIN